MKVVGGDGGEAGECWAEEASEGLPLYLPAQASIMSDSPSLFSICSSLMLWDYSSAQILTSRVEKNKRLSFLWQTAEKMWWNSPNANRLFDAASDPVVDFQTQKTEHFKNSSGGF